MANCRTQTNKQPKRSVVFRLRTAWVNCVFNNGIKFLASDVNADGSVDNLDRLALTRYLANWEGYEDLKTLAA